jgi:glycosyltransferase involved in cell wall biosynthesis
MRVTLLTNTPAPYRVPHWNALGKLCELTVVVLRRHPKNRLWKINDADIDVPILSAEGRELVVRRLDWRFQFSSGAAAKLVANTVPDAIVIGGYDTPACWAVLHWALQRRIPTVLWCESNTLSSRSKGFWFADRLKKYFIRRCQAFYVPSEFSAQYLEDLGADRRNIVVGRNSCDLAKFPTYERVDEGLPEPVLLFIGQLIERKGVRQMLRALEKIQDIPWRLKIAGGGPLMPIVRDWARHESRADRVEILDYVQQDELSEVFRRSDILLFPSLLEVYGLVVVEALTSGLYVVGSDRCAVSYDLLKPGINGEIVSPESTEKFAAATRKALSNLPYDRKQIRATVEDITPEHEAANMLRAAETAVRVLAVGRGPRAYRRKANGNLRASRDRNSAAE